MKEKTIVLVSLCILSIIAVSAWSYAPDEPKHEGGILGVDWLEGWEWRKSHIVNNATGAGSGYQVRITVVNGTGVDSDEIVYIEGKCQPDFDDIRFTSDDGITLQDHWLESLHQSENATFWVKVSADLNTTSQRIYMYYGNDLASSASDGDRAFPFFDHFEGSSLNTTKWYSYTTHGPYGNSDGTVTVAGSELQLYHPEYAFVLVRGTVGFGEGYAIRTRFHTEGTGVNMADFVQWIRSNATGDIGVFGRGYVPGYCEGSGFFRDDYCDNYWVEFDGTSLTIHKDNSWDPKSYFITDICRAESAVRCFVDGVLKQTLNVYINASDQQPLLRVGHYGWEGAHTSCTDWILVRKFIALEPSHGSWGSEESLPYASNITNAPPTPNYDQDVVVSCTIRGHERVLQAILSYRTSLEWSNVSMNGFDELFNATILAQPYATTVQYRICVASTLGYETLSDTYSYIVGDFIAPHIVVLEWKPTCPHPYVPSNVTRENERTLVIANVSEPANASGISEVILSYRVDSGKWWNTTMAFNATDDLWFAFIPKQDGNTSVAFYVKAYDNAENAVESPLFSFEVKSLPLGDLNGDGYVGIDDLYSAAQHFGEENP